MGQRVARGEIPIGADSLRARLRAGVPTVGTFLNMGSSVSTEICAAAGYDWVLVDLEHGTGSLDDLPGQLRAAGSIPALVRVELSARTKVSLALDRGAAGIMFPRIESADEARAAVAYLRFPPFGVRGVAAQTRAGQYGSIPLRELSSLNGDVVGIVQIETLGCLAAAEDIGVIEGVDVLFVGPGDLSYALGVPGLLDDPMYLEALEDVLSAADRTGSIAGILVSSATDVERHLAMGFRFVAIGSDSSMLRTEARSAVQTFRRSVHRLKGRA